MAKYNLETQYSVVGLVEHFNTSISVMEQYLPGNYPSHVLILFPVERSEAGTNKLKCRKNPHWVLT